MSQITGDSQAETIFNRIYECHYSGIYAYFFGRTSNAEKSLDLLQETFARAWKQMPSLIEMEESQHQYWLFSVAKNLLTDSVRRLARWQKIEGDLVSAAQEHMAQSGDPMAVQVQLIALEEAIAQLPEHYRIVLSMSVLGGMNSKQIGEALDIAAGTVRYQLSTARKQLVDHLENGHVESAT